MADVDNDDLENEALDKSNETLRIEEKVIQSALTGYVGFDTITKQIEAKSLKRGFEFNILLVGASGAGKSTFVNTLFCSHLLDSKGTRSAGEEPRKTTTIESVTHSIEENNVKLKVTVTDTPGFGDLINNDNSWEPIAQHILSQYALYQKEESAMVRKRQIRDTRIHVALYFIQPTGHSLKPLDIKAMQNLGEIVNLVPVISKSDSLTIEERQAFKQRIQEELAFHKIKVYPASSESEYDQADAARNAAILRYIPFAVVGSERSIVVNGKAVRGRRQGWGLINIEDETHCDFVPLRDFLMKSHLVDLIETTRFQYYETYRSQTLAQKKKASKAKDPKSAKARV